MPQEQKQNANTEPLLKACHLKKYFEIPRKGSLHAVDDVSFEVNRGETLGLVGESGCGKSTVGNVVMRLLPATAGELYFEGKDIFKAGKTERNKYCQEMQIVFQDPYSSLNPKKTIKAILSEPFQIQKIAFGSTLDKRIDELCDMVELQKSLLDRYPHELDGGMRQVVGIARALSINPKFIVCDEPVSSLDVSVQAKIINLLIDLQKKLDLSYLFISHDLSVVKHISKRIAIMYLGQIVETGDVDTIYEHTMHPYAIALLSAIPQINVDQKVSRIILKGDVPSPMNPKPGCRFAPRCWMAQPSCLDATPELVEVEPGHCVACHFAHKTRELMESAAKTSLDTLKAKD
ncbi:MAG: ABC transporter ATP-binding protein [Aristaeellaceae bacterium]